jgi:YcxB-like protein
MLIKTKLSERDFINASLVLLYTKTSTKVITGIFALFFAIETLTLASRHTNSFFQIIYPLLLLVFPPGTTYFAAKRAFAANKANGEAIEYDFEEAGISTKGETFNGQASWDTIYKVTQTKNWILIWRDRQVANPIPKKDISDEQAVTLKEILDKNNVKNNL